MSDNLFDWYEPDRDAELRWGFGDHSSFALLRPILERFTRHLVTGGDGYLEIPSFEDLRTSNPDVNIGTAFAATFDNLANPSDTSTAVCSLYWIIAARYAQFAGPVIDVVIATGVRHMLDGLRTAVRHAMADPERLDPRAGRTLVGMSDSKVLRLWTRRETPFGHVFSLDEMQLITADCSHELHTPSDLQDRDAVKLLRNSARVNVHHARKAFWAGFDKLGGK